MVEGLASLTVASPSSFHVRANVREPQSLCVRLEPVAVRGPVVHHNGQRIVTGRLPMPQPRLVRKCINSSRRPVVRRTATRISRSVLSRSALRTLSDGLWRAVSETDLTAHQTARRRCWYTRSAATMLPTPRWGSANCLRRMEPVAASGDP